MEDVIADFTRQVDAEYIIQLLPTTPLRDVQVLKNSIQALLEAGDAADSLRSVEPMPESPYKSYEIQFGFLNPVFASGYCQGLQDRHNVDKQGIQDYQGLEGHPELTYSTLSDAMTVSNLPNQSFPPSYRCNGYVDIFKADRVKAGQPWGRCIAYVTRPTIEIDTPEQLRYVDYVVRSRGYRELIQFTR